MGVRRNAGKIDFDAISAVLRPVNEEWFNATISIVKPDIQGGAFDRTTNHKDRTPVQVWTGPARIQAQRWPNVATARQEAVSLRTVVFHIPISVEIDPVLIEEGWRIRVLESPLSKEFERGLFTIVGSVNSSYDWDRRIETVMDQGTSVN